MSLTFAPFIIELLRVSRNDVKSYHPIL